MPLDIPTASKQQGPADPSATLLLSIDANGGAKLGTQPLSADYDALVGELKANQKLQTDGKIAIDAATGTREKYEVLQWLMFQMGGVGPMLGQAHHFRIYAPEKLPYAVDRYTNEARRLYGVMNRRLARSTYIGGSEYSIADMAIFPWTLGWERQGQKLEDFPNMQRWYEAMKARPAVSRGIDVGKELRTTGPMDEAAKKVLFGQDRVGEPGRAAQQSQ